MSLAGIVNVLTSEISGILTRILSQFRVIYLEQVEAIEVEAEKSSSPSFLLINPIIPETLLSLACSFALTVRDSRKQRYTNRKTSIHPSALYRCLSEALKTRQKSEARCQCFTLGSLSFRVNRRARCIAASADVSAGPRKSPQRMEILTLTTLKRYE